MTGGMVTSPAGLGNVVADFIGGRVGTGKVLPVKDGLGVTIDVGGVSSVGSGVMFINVGMGVGRF